MKRERWPSIFWAAVMGIATSVGGIGCMATGLGMPEADLWQMAGACVLWAAMGAVCYQGRLRRLPHVLLLLLGVYLWLQGPLDLSMERMLHHISVLYDRGYDWGLLRWSDADLTQTGVTPALCFLSSAIALTVTGSVFRRRGAWLGVLTAALPFASCMLLTDTVPQTGYLFMLLFGIVLLLLTQAVRREDIHQGNRLSAMVAVPVALALGAMFLFLPQENYTGQAGAQKLQQIVTDWFGKIDTQGLPTPTLPPVLESIAVSANVSAQTVHLEQVGPQREGMTVVMKVTAQETRPLYLRSCAYDSYDGISWKATQQPWAREMDFPESYGQKQTLSLQTNTVHDTLYFTYTPVQEGNHYQYGRAANTGGLKSYTIPYAMPETYQAWWDEISGEVRWEEMEQYLTLHRDTAERANKILIQLGIAAAEGSAGDIYRCAAKITEHVRSSAVYDLNTPKMPAGETDFALWFLENSDTGYCVHYASAAAVLLRAAGIPTRYVTGYLVDARENQTVSVRTKDAHAWVECYIAGIGWIMLEPTASAGISSATQSTEATQATHATTLPTGETAAVTATEGITPSTEDRTLVETGQNNTFPADTEAPGREQKAETLRILRGILFFLGIALTVIAQWRLRVWLRQYRQHSGKTNAQALARWRETALLSKLTRQQPEEQLHALAQKAKFSSHTISREELCLFDAWLTRTKDSLRKRPVWEQLIYTLLLAIY